MIILKPISTPQIVRMYARETTAILFNIRIIDESINKTTTTVKAGVVSDGMLLIELEYDFVNNLFYSVQILDSDELIAYHKIYVTDQTALDKYTMLDGYYKEVAKPETEYITT